MSGRRPNAPIFVLKAGARGDITLPEGATSGGPVVWTRERAGSYMPTPVVYRGLLYVLKNQGILACYDLRSGEQRYETRLPEVGSGFSASPVAADGKLYLSGEDGDVFVVKAGPQFELLARNPMGQPLMATPAIAGGMMLVRGERELFAIGRARASAAPLGARRGPPATPLSLRQLNRATLARQMLLARERVTPLAAIERLVGMQAQWPRPPFIGLWARVEGFRRDALTKLLVDRKVVRATFLRGTLHVASARDFVALRPALQPVLGAGMRDDPEGARGTSRPGAARAEGPRDPGGGPSDVRGGARAVEAHGPWSERAGARVRGADAAPPRAGPGGEGGGVGLPRQRALRARRGVAGEGHPDRPARASRRPRPALPGRVRAGGRRGRAGVVGAAEAARHARGAAAAAGRLPRRGRARALRPARRSPAGRRRARARCA